MKTRLNKDEETLKEAFGLVPPPRSARVAHSRHAITFIQPSKTKQAEKDACDVNLIMAKYAKNKLITHINNAVGSYADVSDFPDYQTAVEIVRQAEDSFAKLPAQARDRFGNDPARFLAFVQDPKNADELRAMGLRSPAPEEPKPVRVEVTNTPPSGGGA